MGLALRAGVAPSRYAPLTMRGQRTGRVYSTPVFALRRGRERYLVAPYGERPWVRNARAASRVTLSRGTRSEDLGIELTAEEAAPILKQYLQETPITRPFFGVAPDAPLNAFVQEASLHPVFLLRA
jgi:hypothetical protein